MKEDKAIREAKYVKSRSNPFLSAGAYWGEWLNDRSRMNGDIHARVRESLRGGSLGILDRGGEHTIIVLSE